MRPLSRAHHFSLWVPVVSVARIQAKVRSLIIPGTSSIHLDFPTNQAHSNTMTRFALAIQSLYKSCRNMLLSCLYVCLHIKYHWFICTHICARVDTFYLSLPTQFDLFCVSQLVRSAWPNLIRHCQWSKHGGIHSVSSSLCWDLVVSMQRKCGT